MEVLNELRGLGTLASTRTAEHKNDGDLLVVKDWLLSAYAYGSRHGYAMSTKQRIMKVVTLCLSNRAWLKISHMYWFDDA